MLYAFCLFELSAWGLILCVPSFACFKQKDAGN